jgi:ubiquinone/menaquinone biosynthesis C-methylase UbiE
MLDWKKIWLKKGLVDSEDLRLLNGYENTTINPEIVSKKIAQTLDIKEETRTLEVGCGAGMIAQFLKCKYVGIDYSPTLISKHKQILDNEVYTCEANNLPFEDDSFDTVFAYSIFQYFPSIDYASAVVQEMIRVSRKSVFIGDLPICSHEKNHLLYDKSMFSEFITTDGYYNFNRFNVLINL